VVSPAELASLALRVPTAFRRPHHSAGGGRPPSTKVLPRSFPGDPVSGGDALPGQIGPEGFPVDTRSRHGVSSESVFAPDGFEFVGVEGAPAALALADRMDDHRVEGLAQKVTLG
jgi:hypothetical protein